MEMVIYGRPKHLGQAGKNIPQADFQFFFFFYVAKLYIIGLWFIEQSGGKPQLSPACYKQEILQSVVQFLYLDVFPKPPWTPDKCV